MDYLLGIDLGTQGVRCALFDLEGRLAATATRPYGTSHPRPMWVEQDPEAWWDATVAALGATVRRAGVPPAAIRALSYDCASCTVVALDDAGRPLRPALLWMDERAHEEAATLTRLGSPHFRYCGGSLSPQWMLPKALWLKRREPETYARAARLVEATDLLTHRLTGQWTASRDNATAKWNYVGALGGWPLDVLAAAGLEDLPAKWPRRVLPVGSAVGPLDRAVADATGLTPATLVAQGGVDAHAGMIGLGAVEPGDLALIVGSSTCHMALTTAPIFADIWGPYPDAVAPDTFLLEGGQTATGSIVQWLLRLAGRAGEAPGAADALEALEAEARQLAPGADGLLVLDHFQGNRTPHKDPHARGVLVGLTLGHSRAHLLRGVYEGVAFGTRQVLENMAAHGFALRRLFAGGGGARSALWMQVHADVLGQPIHLAESPEPMALGAAIWAGLAAGCFRDPREAIARMARVRDVVRPVAATRATYDFYYAQYLEAYRCLRDLEHRLVAHEAGALAPRPGAPEAGPGP
jgi:FGGY-family pentulose kinase